ncbi:MAG: DUF669 domain-containing protein [Spirochaetales bacterium]|nr:DUF669 domain-containing protein [Spirochaetales bacterium]
MPKIDFSTVNDTADFAPLPDGDYLCQLTDVELDNTKSGDEMWRLRWSVLGGEFAGRLLFDNLVFSEKALSRVKLVCGCCGVDTSGAVDLEPTMLLDKQALVTTYQEEYTDDQDRTKVTNRIPFEGYSFVPSDTGDVPF